MAHGLARRALKPCAALAGGVADEWPYEASFSPSFGGIAMADAFACWYRVRIRRARPYRGRPARVVRAVRRMALPRCPSSILAV